MQFDSSECRIAKLGCLLSSVDEPTYRDWQTTVCWFKYVIVADDQSEWKWTFLWLRKTLPIMATIPSDVIPQENDPFFFHLEHFSCSPLHFLTLSEEISRLEWNEEWPLCKPLLHCWVSNGISCLLFNNWFPFLTAHSWCERSTDSVIPSCPAWSGRNPAWVIYLCTSRSSRLSATSYHIYPFLSPHCCRLALDSLSSLSPDTSLSPLLQNPQKARLSIIEIPWCSQTDVRQFRAQNSVSLLSRKTRFSDPSEIAGIERMPTVYWTDNDVELSATRSD
jgi:hypothetical protein